MFAVLAGAGYYAYKQYVANQDDSDLWSEPTQAPDLR
jgi:hypothetical protein